MSRLSDIKLAFLQGDYSNCLWYITKQNCNFRDLAMMARILEMWNDDPNESFQSFFDRIKKTQPFSDYINNSPHRALKNCEFYGLMTPAGSNSRVAYSSNNLTDVYRTIKELCNSNFANTETYQEVINSQLEKMSILVNNQEMNPIMYALKVLIVLGDATGTYKINNKEFKLFVCTCNEWKQFFQSVESIIRFRTDSAFQQAASANYNIANDTRFNLVFDNLSYLSNEGNAISIKEDCIEEVRRKVAEYELGASVQTSGSSTLHVPATIAESSNTLLHSYLTAIRTKPFILLAGISGTGKSRIVRKLAQATITENLQKAYDPDSVKGGFNRWSLHKPANFELIQVKPNWHNSMDVVGYKSNIGGTHYEFTPFIEFVARAWQHQEVPFFLCLDEMNLAPVEQYFAEFLSAIESRSFENNKYVTDPIVKPFESFDTKDANGNITDKLSDRMVAKLIGALDTQTKVELSDWFKKKGLTLPKNLIVMGTVNMDETTFSFSRKVLDRAMSIEMNDVNYNGFFDGITEDDVPELNEEYSNSLIDRPLRGLEADNNHKEEVHTYLSAINNVLDDTPFKLGYRAANEALLYVSASFMYGCDNVANALDEFTLMKILSRIEGDKRSLVTKNGEDLLLALSNVITDAYPKSSKKLEIMSKTLSTKQFVSYWN